MGFDEAAKTLKVKTRSPPVKGKANKEIEEELSALTESRAEIVKGEKAKKKQVRFSLGPGEAVNALRLALEKN